MREPYKGKPLFPGGFGNYLLTHGFLSQAQLEEVLETQKKTGEYLGEILIRLRYLPQEVVREALGNYLGMTRISLTGVKIDPAIAQKVTEDLARRYTLIPIGLQAGVLKVAMADPTNARAIDEIRIFTGYEVEPVLAEPDEVLAAIRQYMVMENSVAQLVSEQEKQIYEEGGIWAVDNLKEYSAQEAPTIRLVDSLLKEAVARGASDIHWEPRETSFVVRYRIDGRLELTRTMPISASRSIIACLKVMARMDISERRLPQDGRMAMEAGTRKIDLRVSSIPTVYGEKVVVRILDPVTAERSLGALGMLPDIETSIRSLLKQPYGIILVVGPTGSGKTTTLYALLKELREESLNIVSIEDPVEYRLPGVVQMSVQAKIGLTFAYGLRAILRQDPDVIMIGEIRDEETARIAIAAALTGHLVLSTLHTNTASEAFTRLADMGIEPYLLAAAIRGVLSQRLVRRLCPQCKTSYELSQTERLVLRLPEGISTVYKATGCVHCRGTGYNGRIGLHEFLLYNQNIKELILSRGSSRDIEAAAVQEGMIPLYRDGLIKAGQGLTSLEEVLRVASGE